MSIKILYGLKNGKLIILDVDTSDKSKKQCFLEGCTSVIVADRSQEVIDCMISGDNVTMDIFSGEENDPRRNL